MADFIYALLMLSTITFMVKDLDYFLSISSSLRLYFLSTFFMTLGSVWLLFYKPDMKNKYIAFFIFVSSFTNIVWTVLGWIFFNVCNVYFYTTLYSSLYLNTYLPQRAFVHSLLCTHLYFLLNK